MIADVVKNREDEYNKGRETEQKEYKKTANEATSSEPYAFTSRVCDQI